MTAATGPGPAPEPIPPPRVNVPAILREASVFREHSTGCCACRDVTAAGDSVAAHIARHFPDPHDQQTAGIGFLVGVALLRRVADVDKVASACAEVAADRLITGPPIGELPAAGVPDGPDPLPGGTP